MNPYTDDADDNGDAILRDGQVLKRRLTAMDAAMHRPGYRGLAADALNEIADAEQRRLEAYDRFCQSYDGAYRTTPAQIEADGEANALAGLDMAQGDAQAIRDSAYERSVDALANAWRTPSAPMTMDDDA